MRANTSIPAASPGTEVASVRDRKRRHKMGCISGGSQLSSQNADIEFEEVIEWAGEVAQWLGRCWLLENWFTSACNFSSGESSDTLFRLPRHLPIHTCCAGIKMKINLSKVTANREWMTVVPRGLRRVAEADFSSPFSGKP